MKKILVVALAFFVTNSFGQTSNDNVPKIVTDTKVSPGNDKTLKVVYADNTINTHKPAYFLNGKFVNQTLIATIDTKLIESVNVVNDNINIDKVQYYGQIYVKTKNGYNPNIISLKDLKEKYTNLKNKPAIFMINGNLINGDYNNYVVDENYLLTIVVDKIKNSNENIDLAIIKLLTRSEDNIKKSTDIRIRGIETTMNQ